MRQSIPVSAWAVKFKSGVTQLLTGQAIFGVRSGELGERSGEKGSCTRLSAALCAVAGHGATQGILLLGTPLVQELSLIRGPLPPAATQRRQHLPAPHRNQPMRRSCSSVAQPSGRW